MDRNRLLPKDVYRKLHGTLDRVEHESELKHVGGGVFELPNGERVKGRADAEARLVQLEQETSPTE